ncbi:hypothetical protein F1880_001193 [Penicillium rolfsii]|nr:hypothetical protein F1880_001193 [Penicillium rolfsii]
MLIDGHKWACEACIRGHRVTSCKHHGPSLRDLLNLQRHALRGPHRTRATQARSGAQISILKNYTRAITAPTASSPSRLDPRAVAVAPRTRPARRRRRSRAPGPLRRRLYRRLRPPFAVRDLLRAAPRSVVVLGSGRVQRAQAMSRVGAVMPCLRPPPRWRVPRSRLRLVALDRATALHARGWIA